MKSQVKQVAPKPTPSLVELQLFPAGPALVTVVEVAKALKICKEEVLALVDTGVFLAVHVGADPNPNRRCLRIQRFSVEAWFLERHYRENGNLITFAESPKVAFWRRWLQQQGTKRP